MGFSSCRLPCLMCSAMHCLEINQGCYNRCLTSHSARYWRFKQCWAWSQLVVALDPSSVIAPQGLLSMLWLLGDVIQADVQLANLPYSVVLSSEKMWKTHYIGSSWRRNWGCREKSLPIVAAKYSHLEFSVSPCPSQSEAAKLSSLAALPSLLPALVYETNSVKPSSYVYFTRNRIGLWYHNWACSWIFDPCQDKTKIRSTRNFKSNISSVSATIIYVLTKINLVLYSCHEQRKIFLWGF